jgi:Protein of unknown function (DUF2934)
MITMTKLNEDAISKLAYRYWEDEGRPDGQAESHWLRAMSELSIPEVAPEKLAKKTRKKR